MAQDTNYDSILGRIAVDQGLCTKQELDHSLAKHKQLSKTNPIVLPDLMVKLGFLTKSQRDRLERDVRENRASAHKIPGYKILGKLGKGAMAEVYKAKQLSLDREVAIKVLPKKFSENPEYVSRFYKEGKAAAKLNHNNIVQAIDVGEAGGYHYFVMECVVGKTLYDDLSKGKVFEEAEALEIVFQVALALKHAHDVGLIHRDIKPKNIMINSEGVVKLADMGLARAVTDLEAAKMEEGKAYGTPYYIAPEQIRGELDIDGRADIYGLGATFYHMVTGKVPFAADDPSDVMRKHLREELVPPDHINATLTAGVSELIEAMMAKKKEDRCDNADDLLEDLESLRKGQSPFHAHQKFNIGDLEQLVEGQEIVREEATIDYEMDRKITNYKLAVVLLSLLTTACFIGMIICALKS